KTAPFFSIFAENETIFAKNVPKIAESGPKTLHFGTPSLLRRRFKPKNADREFPLVTKAFISPYKNGLGSVRFRADFGTLFAMPQVRRGGEIIENTEEKAWVLAADFTEYILGTYELQCDIIFSAPADTSTLRLNSGFSTRRTFGLRRALCEFCG
ncbi:MAG: hypothetical protein IID32_11555, partial [Planctomycetes bacterium]|nr:hypothetical protein [Planctomycetota bacterium]